MKRITITLTEDQLKLIIDHLEGDRIGMSGAWWLTASEKAKKNVNDHNAFRERLEKQLKVDLVTN